MKKRLLILAGFLIFAVSSAYATVTVTSHVIQALQAATFKVTNSMTIIDSGFFVNSGTVGGAGTTSATAVQMSVSQGIASTPIGDGDWVLRIVLIASPTTPASTTFSVNLQFSGGQFGGQLFVKTDTTPSGEEVECFFDVGASLNPPFAYTITVQ